MQEVGAKGLAHEGKSFWAMLFKPVINASNLVIFRFSLKVVDLTSLELYLDRFRVVQLGPYVFLNSLKLAITRCWSGFCGLTRTSIS